MAGSGHGTIPVACLAAASAALTPSRARHLRVGNRRRPRPVKDPRTSIHGRPSMRLRIGAAMLALLASTASAGPRGRDRPHRLYRPAERLAGRDRPAGRAALPLRHRPGERRGSRRARAASSRSWPMDNEVSPEKSLTLLRKAVDDGIHYVTQGNGSRRRVRAVGRHRQEQPARPGKAVDVPELRRRRPGA